MARLTPGMGCHEASARDARQRILAFFAAHLSTPGTPGTQAGPGYLRPWLPGL
jgi:hypothetical protein